MNGAQGLLAPCDVCNAHRVRGKLKMVSVTIFQGKLLCARHLKKLATDDQVYAEHVAWIKVINARY